MRIVSVGISRLFRLKELDGSGFRIEQAQRDPLTNAWRWTALAFATEWNEAHGAMHQMQAEMLDEMQRRQGSFNADRVQTTPTSA
jgi:hypothetical protein